MSVWSLKPIPGTWTIPRQICSTWMGSVLPRSIDLIFPPLPIYTWTEFMTSGISITIKWCSVNIIHMLTDFEKCWRKQSPRMANFWQHGKYWGDTGLQKLTSPMRFGKWWWFNYSVHHSSNCYFRLVSRFCVETLRWKYYGLIDYYFIMALM